MTLSPPAPPGLALLAVDGGAPVRTGPFPRWPRFDEADADAAAQVLLSGKVSYWTGEHGRAFEAELAGWAGTDHAVAVANGTVALEIVLRALGIGPGAEVIVPAATFIATASAVAACGARPVVVDVDPDTQALTADTVRPAVTERTAAVIVVHVGGHPADTAPLVALTDELGLDLVEDCAQAHGARRDGKMVGLAGRVATWSFCQDKIMTTAGEGGAITTSDTVLARRCWELKDHGKSYYAVHEQQHPPGFRWLHDSFGTNGRMTEVQSSIGRLQLPKIAGWVTQRRANADVLRQTFADLAALRLPVVAPGVEHAYYRFYGHVRPELLRPGWDRDRIVAAIAAEGVDCSMGGCTEIHRERAFDAVGRPQTLPVAQWLGRHSLVLPVHPAMAEADVRSVADAVGKVFSEATE
ncbi:DegT/DnrJ/EryC1/StrS family aminotransferase [Pseudonocardia sp. TRM90224]|uniref:DegT/DnrJ/EryC1/StrS family aminotransferase n=1 Tax=Pseudonocardia sp. TRM90224 TaxID=2812678 RepID=UPI001E3D897F|nr:DegT/DnrJ/EryC1/StrS aminotransferase family protein [Pseudonocardia sp. TRM90224]